MKYIFFPIALQSSHLIALIASRTAETERFL